MNEKVSIHVMGLSYSQIQSGAYALILAEDNGLRRIPVIIGTAEAQSIAVALEGIRTPRPLTHDLFVSFAHAFGVKLHEVYIHSYEDGIFSSELTFSDGQRTVKIDARTSDAISIALRTHTPIFTSEDILQRAGFVIEQEVHEQHNVRTDYQAEPDPEHFTIEELERTLITLIDNEDYEEAARISEILNRKTQRLSDEDEQKDNI